jgi:hypothetical protein
MKSELTRRFEALLRLQRITWADFEWLRPHVARALENRGLTEVEEHMLCMVYRLWYDQQSTPTFHRWNAYHPMGDPLRALERNPPRPCLSLIVTESGDHVVHRLP